MLNNLITWLEEVLDGELTMFTREKFNDFLDKARELQAEEKTGDWQERFNKFQDDREYHLHDIDKVDYLDFIQSEISLAEQRGREEGISKCLSYVQRYDYATARKKIENL